MEVTRNETTEKSSEAHCNNLYSTSMDADITQEHKMSFTYRQLIGC